MKSRQKPCSLADFHETWATLIGRSSELRRSLGMLRHDFDTYSRRYVDWRAPYPMRIAGRARKKSKRSNFFSFPQTRSMERPTLGPFEDIAGYLGKP